jgi:nickel-dependent lactate racemase
MEIRVPFGQGELFCTVSDSRKVTVLKTKGLEKTGRKSESDIIRDAMANPIGSAPLAELARGKKKVVVVTSDHTRPVPSHMTLPLMLAEIRKTSPDADITILIGVGTHRATTKEEMVQKFGAEFAKKEHIIVHDPNDESMLVNLGILPSGGQCLINKLAMEADLLAADGFIEPHPFAGFSGGRKSVLPGIASMVTVLSCHNAEFALHPMVKSGLLDGNPVHEDMIFVGQKSKLAFILNVVLDAEKKVIAAFAGDMDKAHRKGCEFVLEQAGVESVKSPIVITSNGGYPLDQNMYQSNKSIQQADLTCAGGGVIIAVNECRDGHGGELFFNAFKGKNPAEVAEEINKRKREETQPDQWASQFLANIMIRHPVIFVTKAPKEMVENFSMKYAPALEEGLRMAEEIVKDKNAPITVLPESISLVIR